jgi:Cu(I)/Ag(I) efflux system membrane fusion protein
VDRAVGENRERLLTAYAQYRLARATIDRNRELHAQKLITTKQFQEVTVGYEVARVLTSPVNGISRTFDDPRS